MMGKKETKGKKKEAMFWADQIAESIVSRERFHFTDAKVPKLKNWAVKSSSSLSGILHIGRLSDILRGEAVYRALKERGFPVEFIYVTEDMDPLRKIPKGVPKEFKEFIGFSVSDIPDPSGCHESYAAHYLERFLSTFKDFLFFEPKVYSMREEYRKGSFNEAISLMVKETEKAREIINKFKENPLESSWSPWKPICDKCGNLQTTVVEGVKGGKVKYVCRDYHFEKFTARGCGHEGESDLSKPNGKLVWKSEWAAQWKRWNVCSEGAGKEYESKNSAFWINAEICERVLCFPAPKPIFYEHLNIDGAKMSASVGNVVFPSQWLEVSRPETLKYLFLKRITKARSFSWTDVPVLELELDRVTESFLSKKEGKEKEAQQSKKLYLFSSIAGRKLEPIPVDYALAVSLVQLFKKDDEIVSRLVEMGHLKQKESPETLKQLRERLQKAREWVEKYAPENFRLRFLEKLTKVQTSKVSDNAKKLFPALIERISAAKNAEEVQSAVFGAAKENNLSLKELFQALYLVLIGKTSGPKIGSLVFALGKERVIERLKELV